MNRLVLAVYCALAWGSAALGATGEGASGPCSGPEARQFDFWIGEWDVLNKVIQEDGSWQESGRSTARIYPALDGCVIIEHWQGRHRGNPLYGFSMRAFDPREKQWKLVLNWPSPGRPGFGLLTGQFTHGRGEFFFQGQSPQGETVYNRYSFSDARGDTLRWDAARSKDRVSWTTYWVMEFTRRAPLDRALINGPSPRGWMDYCPDERFRRFDFLIGDWFAEDAAGQDAPVRLQAFPIVNGCALLGFSETGGENGYKQLRVRSYHPPSKKWICYQIDTRRSLFERLEGGWQGDSIELTGERHIDTTPTALRVVWTTDKSKGPLREAFVKQGEQWRKTSSVRLRRAP